MSKWPTVAIGDVARVIGGGTPKRSNPEFYGGDIPWVTPKDMKRWKITDSQVRITKLGLENSTAKLAPANSVLVVVRSGVLKHTLPVAISERSVAINQDMKALICSEDIDPSYLAYFIKERSGTILQWVRATTADNFPIENLMRFHIPLPSMREQRRVVQLLDCVGELRAKRHEALGLLDDLTQYIFLEMFGDPANNPNGWPMKTIGDLVDSANYGTSEKADEVGDIPVLRMGNITSSGRIDLSDLKFMDRASVNEKYLVRRGDVLFNRTNSPELVGKSAIYRGSDELAFAGYLVRVRMNKDNDPEYLAAFLNTKYAKRVLRGMCKSIVGMANINARELQGIAVGEPPLDLQVKFAERVRAVESVREIHLRHLAELDALFASLQHRMFRGELSLETASPAA